ncbi:hypothetical protein, partial [Rhizobium oryzihabitans]|uniref:hypothetical protein n=1 Tax=Rhizobium oryzihabitans TaxID=2267833 RepID=UPI004036BC33
MPDFRPLPFDVIKVGQEATFRAKVHEDGWAVTELGGIMPSEKEVWALLTLTMAYADVIFKEATMTKEGVKTR